MPLDTEVDKDVIVLSAVEATSKSSLPLTASVDVAVICPAATYWI